jgi:hypothetical protein
MESSAWGRIADDGTAYVRTADGERVIGSWQAGSVEEGLAFYTRRYDDLAAEVRLLAKRASSPATDIRAIRAAVTKLQAAVASAAAIGDLAGLEEQLAGVLAILGERQVAHSEERAKAAAAAADVKRALVAEAERLAAGEDWRAGSERFRVIVEEWKAVRGVDRRTDSRLWEEFAAARRSFDARRRAHFAAREQERAATAQRKESLIRDAEKLADSTDWAATARAYRDLMTAWKAAGRASRQDDDALWARFKAAQDAFFTRRSEALHERDTELETNLAAKQALLAEAEGLDASADPDGARKRLRSIHDRWEKVGHVPREQRAALEDRLGEIERRIRDAASSSRQVTIPESPLIIRLRESVTKLEARLVRARSAGDDALVAETETALGTQREWLAQAESSG